MNARMKKSCFPILAALCIASGSAEARDCTADAPVQVSRIDFTGHARSVQAQDRMLYLPDGSRAAHVHLVATGNGTISYRWYRDDKAVAAAQVVIGSTAAGPGATGWDSWSSLSLPSPPRASLRVQVLGPGQCVLAEAALASTPFTGQPQIRAALDALAVDDATGAKIALNNLPVAAGEPALQRFAHHLLDNDVALARASRQVRDGQLFLVETTLRDVERRLGPSPIDQSLRMRIGGIRRAAAAMHVQLRHDDIAMVHAMRHLLEMEKLFRGDYPLLREHADKLVTPALARAGGDFTMADWHPTLRGYQLVLQDKRTGESFVVAPD